MSQSCTYCQGSTRDTVICPRCINVTRHNLSDMRGHAIELTTAMIKDYNFTEKSDGGKSADPTISWAAMGDRYLSEVAAEIEKNPIATPYQKTAAATLRELKATLVSWTRLLNEERGIGFTKNNIPALANHLYEHLNIIASHEAAGEFVAEITNLVKRIMVVIDSPPFRTRVAVGHCIMVIDGMHCTGEVIAYIHSDGDVLGKLECRRCKKEWEPVEWADVGPRIMGKKAG